MPVYEYECPKCGEVTEAIRPMRDADAPLACAKCGHAKTLRKHSVFMAAASKPAGSAPSAGGGCGPGCGCHLH